MKKKDILVGLFLLLCWCWSVVSVYPYIESSCGGGVRVYETLIPTEGIHDEIFFLETNWTEIIFLRTVDGRALRSLDEGKSWEDQTPKFINFRAISTIYSARSADGSYVVYFISSGGRYWISEDNGETYLAYEGLPDFSEMLFHPTQPKDYVIGLTTNRNARHDFWLAVDGEWVKVMSDLPSYTKVAWASFENSHPNRIYVIADSKSDGVFDGEIFYSDDFFKTQKKIPNLVGVYRWYMVPPFQFVIASCITVNTACDTKVLSISEDGGNTFSQVVFPDDKKETTQEQDFDVYELADQTIWVHVSRSCLSDFCWGDIFHSYAADQQFTLSLKYQKNEDFTKYNSVNGIYIANQYITPGRAPISSDNVRTLITFNKGGEWNLIEAPAIDSRGQPTNCFVNASCSLHIHGWTSNLPFFTYFYSVPNAIGIMIATGNIGSYLSKRSQDINTYISFNGGVHWKEITKGAWIPEIGDHGSIITILQQTQETNSITYTINGGEEWSNCVFSNSTIKVSNIRVSDGWDQKQFLVYGVRTTGNTKSSVIIHLDFDSAFSGKCDYPSDFEPWSPSDEHGHCVLGARINYMRRTTGKTCYFGEDHEHTSFVENCTCNLDDFECDHCFYRPDLNSPCELECMVPNLPPEPSYCKNSTDQHKLSYSVPMGYRLLDGDTCLSPKNKPKGIIPCNFEEPITPTPPTPFITPNNIIYLYVLVGTVGILIIIAVASLLWKFNESFRSFFQDACGLSTQDYDSVAEDETDDENDKIELDE